MLHIKALANRRPRVEPITTLSVCLPKTHKKELAMRPKIERDLKLREANNKATDCKPTVPCL